MQIFGKECIEYPFTPIALANTGITKESLSCNAIANAQCERNLISFISIQFKFQGNMVALTCK